MSGTPGRLVLIGGLIVWTLPAIAWCDEPTARRGIAVIGPESSWRYFIVRKTEQSRMDGTVQPVAFGYSHRTTKAQLRSSPPPPADWFGPEFDDARWPRATLPIHANRARTASLICARAKFVVKDPAKAADMILSLAYRGGVVVYLNGGELVRAHMPDGKATFDTPAVDYPRDVYVDPDGFLLRLGFHDPSKYKDRFARRDRRLSRPAGTSKLVKGVNTLAVQVHRPLTDSIMFTGKPRRHSKGYCQWETLALLNVELTAANWPVPRPATGLRVWNHLATQRIVAGLMGDANEPLRPVHIRGARNGAFSGVVVAGSTEPIRGLKVRAADLIHRIGEGRRGVALRVEVRFGVPDGVPERRQPRWFDSLEPAAPGQVQVSDEAGVAMIPIWITVHVPADAGSGDYQGKLTVTADGGGPIDVPIRVSVADWTLPPATRSESWWWLAQSPETLAEAYRVEMWSDAHWKLIARSFELMGQVGTRIVYVPLFRRSHFGNEHSMIRWVKKPDGSWKHDFSVFERYLGIAHTRLGKLDVVCIHSWPRTSGGAYFGQAKHAKKAAPFLFTVLDPATGGLAEAEGPTWDDEKEIRAFLQPVFDGIRRRLKQRGLDEAMMVGIGHDVMPSKNCVAALKEVSGGAPWVMHCHPRRWSCHGEPIGYLADVWSSPSARWPGPKRGFGWQSRRHYATFPRAGSNTVGRITDSSAPAQFRVSLEGAMCAGIRGFGWVGADYWPVYTDPRKRVGPVLDRYPYDRRTNLGMAHSVYHLLGRGKDGPVPTVRHQMVRAGLQETEARVFIERALNDSARRAKLGEELATRCQALLDRRLEAIIWGKSQWDTILCADWEKLSAELYAAAAEVSAVLEGTSDRESSNAK